MKREREVDDGDHDLGVVSTTQGSSFSSSEAKLALTPFSLAVENFQDDSGDPQSKVAQLVMRAQTGSSVNRKTAGRQLGKSATELGADAVLSVLSQALRDCTDPQHRQRIVRLLLRVIPKLDIENWISTLVEVVEPLLLDKDRSARRDGILVIGAVVRKGGLRPLLSSIRDDIETGDEAQKQKVAATIAAVATTIGVEPLITFLEVLTSNEATVHVGLVILQRIARESGSAVLPFLEQLIAFAQPGFDGGQRMAIAAASAISALARASVPYGIEAFEPVAPHLWRGLRRSRGGYAWAAFANGLAALVPLMDTDSAAEFVVPVVAAARPQLRSSDDDARRGALIVLQQCLASLPPAEVRTTIIPEIVEAVVVRRVALDVALSGIVVRTISLAVTVSDGGSVLAPLLVAPLKDASSPLQRLAIRILDAALALGPIVVSSRVESLLVDAVLVCFQSHELALTVAPVLSALMHSISEPQNYSSDVVAEIRVKFASPEPQDREAAARVLQGCVGVLQMPEQGAWLYEQLGEEYPSALAAVLDALRAVVECSKNLEVMEPPISDLLPRLTPTLRNRNERVQESCVTLIGLIARNGGAEIVPPREWLRICFELLELYKAPRLSVRRAANKAFGAIANGLGPGDVLATLLMNLRAPDRQSRVSTSVAIGAVAEACEPFTVLPVLFNEYRSPDRNVQQGVLKALEFLFEYIGPLAADYVEQTSTLVDHALTQPSPVSRQTAASIVRHIALSVASRGHDDVLLSWLNEIMPSVFESSPHMMDRIFAAVDALRFALGPGIVLNYLWAGLFHPARKVREAYWQMYNDVYVGSGDALVPCYPEHVEGMDVWF